MKNISVGRIFVKKNMVNSFIVLQMRIENRIHGLPTMCFGTYIFFVTMVFMFSGVMLFFYTSFMGVDPFDCQVLSSYVFYLVIGFICFFIWIGVRCV